MRRQRVALEQVGGDLQQVAGGQRAFQAKTELLSPVKQATSAVRPDLDDVIELEG